MPIFEQLSFFDQNAEPSVGDYVESHGAVICHIMRPAFIGKNIVVDKSTQSHEWYQLGVLEDYISYEGRFRAIVYTGERQRQLITFYPGIEIYEAEKRF